MSSGAVIAPTSTNVSAERWASAISASVSPSIVRMELAARSALATESCRSNGLPCSAALSTPARTHEPNRLSPQRRWWSRKESGAPTVKVCNQSETLASSTAIGFLSTP